MSTTIELKLSNSISEIPALQEYSPLKRPGASMFSLNFS